MITKFLFIFLFIFCFKLFKNISSYIRLKVLEKHYNEFLFKSSNKIFYETKEVLELFEKSGIEDNYIPHQEITGINSAVSFKLSVFGNFPSRIKKVSILTSQIFKKSQGVFLRRIKESFNPIYWIETIIYLPKNVLNYLGLKDNKTSFKVLNLILSFVYGAIGILLTLYPTEIKNIISKFFNSF